jgi:hypothetical protein
LSLAWTVRVTFLRFRLAQISPNLEKTFLKLFILKLASRKRSQFFKILFFDAAKMHKDLSFHSCVCFSRTGFESVRQAVVRFVNLDASKFRTFKKSFFRDRRWQKKANLVSEFSLSFFPSNRNDAKQVRFENQVKGEKTLQVRRIHRKQASASSRRRLRAKLFSGFIFF